MNQLKNRKKDIVDINKIINLCMKNKLQNINIFFIKGIYNVYSKCSIKL